MLQRISSRCAVEESPKNDTTKTNCKGMLSNLFTGEAHYLLYLTAFAGAKRQFAGNPAIFEGCARLSLGRMPAK